MRMHIWVSSVRPGLALVRIMTSVSEPASSPVGPGVRKARFHAQQAPNPRSEEKEEEPALWRMNGVIRAGTFFHPAPFSGALPPAACEPRRIYAAIRHQAAIVNDTNVCKQWRTSSPKKRLAFRAMSFGGRPPG